jgi:hypothetical protein
MMTKSAPAWIVFALGVALALLIAVHGLLVEVDFNACFENYGNMVSPDAPRVERVGEMSWAALAQTASSTIGEDESFLFALGLLPLCPFLLGIGLARNWRSAVLCAELAFVAVLLIGAFYVQSLSNLFGGSTEFYDCDRNGVSVAIAYAPVSFFILGLVAVGVVGTLKRTFSIPG